MLPNGWRVQSVLELGRHDPNTVQTGPFGSQLHAEDYVEEGIPLLLIRNIGENGLVLDGLPRISEQDAARLVRYALKSGDVVFSRVGRVGSCFLATKDQDGWIISGQTLRIRLPYDDLHPQYFLYALRDKEAQDFITGASVGTTRSSINTSILKSLPVRVPSYPEQVAIADILTTVDQAIEQTEALIAKQRRIKAGLLHDLLTRGIDEHGRLRDPSTHRFKPSPVGSVPEEWEVVRLGDVCRFASGGTPSRTNPDYWNGRVPWVKTAEVDYKVITETEEYITEMGLLSSSAKVFPKGTLIMAIYGEGITRGKVALLGIEAATNQACLAFFPIQILQTEYLYRYLMTAYTYLRELSYDGSQKNLSATLVGNIFVTIPSLSEQHAICAIMSSFEAYKEAQQTSLAKLARLKAGLMQDLLSGRVSVAELAKLARMC
jgi:type I restriction enzyme S subunit